MVYPELDNPHHKCTIKILINEAFVGHVPEEVLGFGS